MCAIVKRVGAAALEVNECADFLGMTAAYRTQLFAGNRVPDKDWLVQMKGGDDGKDIFAKLVGRIVVVIGSGIARLAKAAAGNAVHVIFAGKFGRKLIERVRGVAQRGEEDERPASAAPVEDFELDAWLHGDELHGVR